MQWFRNLQLYRLPSEYTPPTVEELNEKLAQKAFIRSNDSKSTQQGFLPPAQHAPDLMAYPQQGTVLIRLQTEEKLLPTSIVKQFVADKIAEIESSEHRSVGKKERRELMENTRDELLPRAFGRQRSTMAMWDLDSRFVMIDSAHAGRAEVLLTALREALGHFPARLIHTAISPTSAMTLWLENGAPSSFTIEADCELREANQEGAIVRYQRQNLEAEEVKNHLKAGKTATKLALSWCDKLSFVLTDQFALKRISMLDLLADTLDEYGSEGKDGLFDASFTLMLGEFQLMLRELIAALGGEVA